MHGKIHPIFAILLLLVLPVSLTAQIASIPSVAVASGTAVGGGGNLTTVGAIPYVTSSGVLAQDAPAFFWDATNDRLGVGTASPSYSYDSGANSTSQMRVGRVLQGAWAGVDGNYAFWQNGTLASTSGNYAIAQASNGLTILNSSGGQSLDLRIGNAGAVRLTSSLNFLIGGTTDGNYKLDVQASGSTGTFRVFDQTATTGSTLAVIQAGAGQGSNPLQQWNDYGGTFQARIGSSGTFQSKASMSVIDSGATLNYVGLFTTGVALASNVSVAFSGTTEATATKDLHLFRSSANVLGIGSGSGTTGGGLLIEALKSTTGTRYVCVDTTGRLTSSATACSGT